MYRIHKNMKDVCFQIFKQNPWKTIGFWINISSPNEAEHFPIDRKKIKTPKLLGADWKSFYTTKEARAWVRQAAKQ